MRLLAGSGKKWPQGLHRSTEYPLISTRAKDFSLHPVQFWVQELPSAASKPQRIRLFASINEGASEK
jgi:hypothetical protein